MIGRGAAFHCFDLKGVIIMNSVNIIGRLTKDPEMKKTEEGVTICSFVLAVDDTFSKEDRTDFIRVTVFGNQGDLCEKYLRKGFIAGVSGRVRTDSYTDAEGVKRYPVKVTADRVQFLQWPERNEESITV
jgi:single-strand DNA-binding protein